MSTSLSEVLRTSARTRELPADRVQRFDAVRCREPHIQQRDVRPVPPERLQRLSAVAAWATSRMSCREPMIVRSLPEDPVNLD